MKILLKHLLLALALASLVAVAQDQRDAGMVTLVQGNVTYAGKPVIAFMKLRIGDKLAMPRDARLQMVYFEGGRQESWRGETRLEVGATESKANQGAPQPEVKQLPPAVLQRLAKAPGMLADMKSRTGMVMMRAMAPEDTLRELDDTYAAMRSQSADEDVTPELYLLAGMDEMKRYREMKKPLEEMRRRQPDNQEIAAVADHYAKLMARKSGNN